MSKAENGAENCLWTQRSEVADLTPSEAGVHVRVRFKPWIAECRSPRQSLRFCAQTPVRRDLRQDGFRKIESPPNLNLHGNRGCGYPGEGGPGAANVSRWMLAKDARWRWAPMALNRLLSGSWVS
ncbi:MAG: hypothetical protein RMN51_10130 [Verrucomicrobiota bacterium]|nr:hypothetical protein [Limisphaera sp.]MDW8382444.1 hypothetical protein [Verrucomicrobiota bacterium]